MDGVPYDVKPSASVEAVVMESEAVVETEAVVESEATLFWGQSPLMTVSTMRTVRELSLDVSDAAGDDAEKGVSGRDGGSAGQHGESGSDASQAVAGASAGRVVLYMSTTDTAAQRGDSATATLAMGQVLLPTSHVEPFKSHCSFKRTSDVSQKT
jgi:hypothetical protein